MSKITDTWNTIEINRELYTHPGNILKIDGKEIKGILEVSINYGVNNPYPIVTITLQPKRLTAKVKANKRQTRILK